MARRNHSECIGPFGLDGVAESQTDSDDLEQVVGRSVHASIESYRGGCEHSNVDARAVFDQLHEQHNEWFIGHGDGVADGGITPLGGT